MKKIISICVMCLFFAIGTNAANTKPEFKDFNLKKITFSLNHYSAESNIIENFQILNELPFRFCYVSGSHMTGSGYDPYGNYWETWEVTVTCIES